MTRPPHLARRLWPGLALVALGLLLPFADSAGGQVPATSSKETTKTAPAPAPATEALPSDWATALHWRCIGPANMGGRITAICRLRSRPHHLLGRHRFRRTAQDRSTTASPSSTSSTRKPPFPSATSAWLRRTATSSGSAPARAIRATPSPTATASTSRPTAARPGRTWDSRSRSRSARSSFIPRTPTSSTSAPWAGCTAPTRNAACYKTTDGGKTWKKILYVDDKTGVIDMRMHPTDPDTLLVAMWERQRDGFDGHRGEPA